MISNISGNGLSDAMQMRLTYTQQSISQEQQQIIADTLAKFDPNNLTQAEAASIVETFKDSGIQPGREMAEAMAASGFDAKAVGDLAGVERPPHGDLQMIPKGQPATLIISEEMLQQLNDLLDEYYSGNLSDDKRETTLSAIKEIFQQTVPEGGLVNLTV